MGETWSGRLVKLVSNFKAMYDFWGVDVDYSCLEGVPSPDEGLEDTW